MQSRNLLFCSLLFDNCDSVENLLVDDYFLVVRDSFPVDVLLKVAPDSPNTLPKLLGFFKDLIHSIVTETVVHNELQILMNLFWVSILPLLQFGQDFGEIHGFLNDFVVIRDLDSVHWLPK